MASRQASAKDSAAAAAEQQHQRDGDFEPVYEWLDAGTHYLLRVNVPEFKKEDFQVHVDPAGRLTVRGQHGSLRLNKVFQLPPTCNLDAITGRLEASVLVLTVPKKPATRAAAAAALPPKAKQEEETKKADEDDIAGKPPPPPPPPTDHKAPKTDSYQAERRTQLAAREKKEEEPKATAPAAPPPQPAARERHDEEEKARAEHKARLSREADRRIEAARARLAAQQASRPAPAPAPEKKAPCWKERAAEEGLKLAEAIGKNKEVVATAVAAFALGVFVSTKLFSRNN